MRELNGHKVNGCNEALRIEVLDEPGAGGANHLYRIEGMNTANNASANDAVTCVHILFQNGPIPEKGTNGVTHEALLAIIIDRLQSFQKGPYACRENAIALTKLEEAQMWLQARTVARLRRGVEGTHEK
jgi:hypothetical protein